MKDRLLKFINFKGLSQRQFLIKAGLSTSYLSVVKDDFGVSALFSISQNFPELNVEWLKTGKGEMINKGFENKDNDFDKLSNFFFANGEQKPVITESIAKIPNFDVLELVKSGKIQNLEYMGAFNQFPPFDFYFRNDRVSMEPQFMRGDLIALSALQENAVIESGAPYIIDTKSIGFIFRNIYERGDKYECKVSNPKSQLEDINVEKGDVIKIYRVVGLVRTNF
jgi:hypothetical protein